MAMENDIRHLVVPDLPVFGERGIGGARVYRREGTDEELREWNDAVMLLTGCSAVSPGSIAMKCTLGRIEFYRLAEAGFLTLFLFHVRKRVLPLLKGLTYRTGSYGYAPVSELLSLESVFRNRPDLMKIAVGDGGIDTAIQGRFEGPDWSLR
jgi:hypothetical protein